MISKKLKSILKQRKVTQKELADKLGLTPNGVSQMISNDKFKLNTLEDISAILKVPMTYWFETEEKRQVIIEEPGIEYKTKMKETMKQLEKDLEYFRERVIKLEKENEELKRDKNSPAKQAM